MIEARTKVHAALKAATDAISELKITAQLELKGFEIAADGFKAQHQEAMNQQAQHSVLIDLNQKLSVDYNAAVEAERTARRLLQDNLERLNGLASARATLAQDLESRRTILKKAATTVAGHSSDTLMAKIGKDSCPEEYVSALMAVADASYIPDVSQKISQWIKATGTEGWPQFADQILEVYRKKVMLGSPPEPGEELLTELAGCLFGDVQQVSPRSAKKIYTSLDDGSVADILAAVPRDFIVLTYIDEGGRKISFDKASPGQQASALLELLLRQQAGTLIIDQPEDDLDNKVIMKIVDLIKKSKSNRQLVFATHNPNIVVNGDADKIISLTTGEIDPRPGEDSVRISVDQDGAIETLEVKAVITKVMEGGAGAFDLRRRKYRFE